MHMDIRFVDDLVWVSHRFHMFVVSCLVVELKTVIAAQSAKLLAPHLKKKIKINMEYLIALEMITLIVKTHVFSY